MLERCFHVLPANHTCDGTDEQDESCENLRILGPILGAILGVNGSADDASPCGIQHIPFCTILRFGKKEEAEEVGGKGFGLWRWRCGKEHLRKLESLDESNLGYI